jgi:hypothetical protein
MRDYITDQHGCIWYTKSNTSCTRQRSNHSLRNSNRMQQHALFRVAGVSDVKVTVPPDLNRPAFLQVLAPTRPPPLQQKDSRWPRQVYAVLLDLFGVPLSEDEFSSPTFLLFLFVLIQYVHLICLATTLPALLPFSTFCFSISTCSHLYRETACLPSFSEATCGRSAVINFQKTLSVSSASVHLGINFRASRKLSTNAMPNKSSITRTCHFLFAKFCVSPINSV